MQWNQPGPADRPRVLTFAASGAILGYALAFGLISSVLRGVPLYNAEASLSLLNRIAVAAMALLVFGLATLCTDIFVKIRRGPPTRTRRVLRSEDGSLLLSLMAISLATLAFASGGSDALMNGRADSRVLGWILVGSVGALGITCFAGALIVGWNAITKGPSTLTLEGTHVPAGLPLHAVLEIPFSAASAPPATVSVQLTRWEAPISSDDATSSSVVWCEQFEVNRWTVAGKRRSSARVTYELPEGAPEDLTDPRVSHVWSLDVHPLGNIAWNAQFTLPVRFVEDAARAA